MSSRMFPWRVISPVVRPSIPSSVERGRDQLVLHLVEIDPFLGAERPNDECARDRLRGPNVPRLILSTNPRCHVSARHLEMPARHRDQRRLHRGHKAAPAIAFLI